MPMLYSDAILITISSVGLRSLSLIPEILRDFLRLYRSSSSSLSLSLRTSFYIVWRSLLSLLFSSLKSFIVLFISPILKSYFFCRSRILASIIDFISGIIMALSLTAIRSMSSSLNLETLEVILVNGVSVIGSIARSVSERSDLSVSVSSWETLILIRELSQSPCCLYVVYISYMYQLNPVMAIMHLVS